MKKKTLVVRIDEPTLMLLKKVLSENRQIDMSTLIRIAIDLFLDKALKKDVV